MPKFSYSLAIAFAFHILILAVSTYFVDNEPLPFLIDSKSIINNVQLGHKPAHSSHTVENLKSQTKSVSLNVNSASGSESASEGGSPEAQSGNGNGNSSYDFTTSAVSYKEPIYPRLAIKRELQGDVSVKVTVSSEGKPTNIEILKSSGHDLLDRAAIDAMAGWRFLPRPTSYFVEKNIVFKLKN